MLLDKYAASHIDSKKELNFGSDADYGKGTKVMKNELGLELQKLANQGYLLLNIVHAEDKTDFATQRAYVGTSLSSSLYGVAEKFVDQIIYLKKDWNPNTGKYDHTIWFNGKGGFEGAGGRFTPEVDSVPCSYANLEKALTSAMRKISEEQGAKAIETDKPSVIIESHEFDYDALMARFQELAGALMGENPSNEMKITAIIDNYLGKGHKVGEATPDQAEQIDAIVREMELLKKH